jgi:hypothetical protein
MKMGVVAATLLVAAFAPSMTSGAEPQSPPYDYFLLMRECRILGASFAPLKGGSQIRSMETQGFIQGCERTAKKKLACTTVFDEKDAKPVHLEYLIETETSIMSVWRTDNWGDYAVIDHAQGTAVVTVRMLTASSVASKVCQGMYLTADEYEAIRRKQRAP